MDSSIPIEKLARVYGDSRESARLFRHVLVAEDDLELRRFVVTILRRLGCRVTEAKNGIELLDRLGDAELESRAFDLIVTDIRMPGVTGLSVLRGLRGLDARHLASTPVLVMSAFGDDATRSEVRRLGGLFLDKPFELEEFRTWSKVMLGA